MLTANATLDRTVDAVLASPKRIERLINRFKWGTRPTVPDDLGKKILLGSCSAVAMNVALTREAARLFLGPEEETRDNIVATISLGLEAETFYVNHPAALNSKIPLLLYPHLAAHIMLASSGYASPATAARVISGALAGAPASCEWVDACYSGPSKNLSCVQQSIKLRKRKSAGIYGSFDSKILLILQELLTDGGVPFNVDYV